MDDHAQNKEKKSYDSLLLWLSIQDNMTHRIVNHVKSLEYPSYNQPSRIWL